LKGKIEMLVGEDGESALESENTHPLYPNLRGTVKGYSKRQRELF